MRTLCLLMCVTSCALVACQQPPNNKGPHSHSPPSGQRPRRLQGPIEHKRVSFPQHSGARTHPSSRKPQSKGKKHGVPPYAVQMEPLVQYSQPDPLYTIEKQYISEAKSADSSSNDLIKKTFPADVTEAESISRVGQITHARLRPPTHLHPPAPPRQAHHHHPHMHDVEFSSYGTYYEGPPEAFEAPEPIIEIIIRESNESLPAPPPLPTPPPPKKVKEPVQVFYVKYKKDPSGGYGGEEKVIYDPPIPAVTPPANNEDSHETHEEPQPIPQYGEPEEATAPPPPSTTLKAIIRPDSETFHANGGVRITFGGPEGSDGHGEEKDHQFPPIYGQLQESAPQPAIAFPSHSSKPLISRSSSGGTSVLTKRNPAPFNPNFPQPSAPPTFQQTPQFPPQDFQPPSLNPTQYSTLPQNYNFVRPQPPQSPPPQRYTTINNPPPVQQQYHTINQPSPGFQPFPQPGAPQPTNSFQQQRVPTQEQHQKQVEQVNRLQQQQQQLQQQLAQQHRFQPQFTQDTSQRLAPQQGVQQQFPSQPSQPQFPPQQSQPQFSQQPSQSQFSQQSSQSQFSQQSSQPQFSLQPSQTHLSQPTSQVQFSQQPSQQVFPQQNQFPHQNQQNQPNPNVPQYRQPPQLQYSTQSPDIVKSVDNSNSFHNHRQEVQPSFLPTPRPQTPTRTASPVQQYKSTTTEEPVTEVVTEDPKKVEQDKKRKEEQQKKNIENLPDEVPDDLREQLLSSGILSNADIQILDYDKIGDIPIESLPPEALANFQQVAGSERVVKVVRRPADPAEEREDADSASSELRSVTVSRDSERDMEMKVVRFNPDEDRGVAERYMREGATQLAPVVLNDNKYNRYLPLQVSGAQFPVPDVPELRGRNVTSVVVLAPVDYEFLTRRDPSDDGGEGRVGRSAAPVLEVQGVHFVAGDVLKTLVRMPSIDNYRRWLEKENQTSADKQSVVLLVVGPGPEHPDKEIFMYDIASGHVSKLRGELSSTFVQVAESNSNNQDLEEISDSPAGPGGDFTVRRASSSSQR